MLKAYQQYLEHCSRTKSPVSLDLKGCFFPLIGTVTAVTDKTVTVGSKTVELKNIMTIREAN